MEFTESLKKTPQFRLVYNRGKSSANKYLVLYIFKNRSETNKIGISVSKKVGNSVVRSRISRLIRESYRLNEQNMEKGNDLVFIARNGAKGKSYKEINSALLHLCKKNNIYIKEEMKYD